MPGFYLTDGGHDLHWSVDSPADVAAILSARAAPDVSTAALVVANPLPLADQLDPASHDAVLADGLERLRAHGISGKAVTPYLLAHFHTATGGRSLDVNVRIILRNAELAAQVAVAVAA